MTGRQVSATDAEFLAGRDLAVTMIRDVAAFFEATPGEQTSINARYREGAPQANVALAHLRKIIENPALADGFAAVLTDGFANSFPDVEFYEALSISEMRGAKHDTALQGFLAKVKG